MKKILCLLLAPLFALLAPFAAYCEGEIQTEAKSVYLIDAGTGQVLYAVNENEALPPASVTKIMTLLLIFEAIDEGRMSLDERVSVSERAAGMGGSQIYLEPGEEMTVDELLKSVVVASANDAAAALAEQHSGSLESFVAAMNARAGELGMNDTHFENTNGLDDTTKEHLTSAKDVALMSRELLKHEKVFDYTTIWMDTVRNGAFTLTNTNRLVRFYKGANGLKTGSTSKAGFCISATALRDGLQLIAVVMGSPTRDERNRTAAALLDYGFANYESRNFEGSSYTVSVTGGKTSTVRAEAQPCGFLLRKGQGKNVEVVTEVPEKVPAPVNAGEQIGQIVYKLNGEEIERQPVILLDSSQRLGVFDIFLKLLSSYTIF